MDRGRADREGKRSNWKETAFLGPVAFHAKVGEIGEKTSRFTTCELRQSLTFETVAFLFCRFGWQRDNLVLGGAHFDRFRFYRFRTE